MKALILTCTAVATLALAAAAAAEPGNGATVTNSYGCAEYVFTVVCTDVQLVTKTSSTPSGGLTYVMNGTTTSTITPRIGNCVLTRTEPVHVVIHQRDGEPQVAHYDLVQEMAVDCGGTYSHTCTQTIKTQIANGENRVSRYELVCTTP